jgi:hypothetical protein
MQQQKVKVATTRKAAVRMPTKTTARVPRQAKREAVRTKEARDPNAPTLTPCSLRGPDGILRPGWELWVGEILFGRADTQESLLEYYARIHEPMPSGHWKDRSWQSAKVARRSRSGQYDEYEDDQQFDSAMWD